MAKNYSATRKQWYLDNLDRERASRRVRAHDNRRLYPARELWRHAQKRAKRNGMEFSIKVEDVIIPEFCPVFHQPLIINTPYAPSLDRVDNSKGYISGNIQVISKKANTMKHNASPEELQRFADWVNQSPLLCKIFTMSSQAA